MVMTSRTEVRFDEKVAARRETPTFQPLSTVTGELEWFSPGLMQVCRVTAVTVPSRAGHRALRRQDYVDAADDAARGDDVAAGAAAVVGIDQRFDVECRRQKR